MWGRKPERKLAVALTCADWRLHQRKVELTARLGKMLGVTGVDLICVPGPDGMLKPGRAGEWQAALAQINLLIGLHAPLAVVVLAHQCCAGHPVTDAQHDADVAATTQALKRATGFAGRLVPAVAVYRSDAVWDFKALTEI